MSEPLMILTREPTPQEALKIVQTMGFVRVYRMPKGGWAAVSTGVISDNFKSASDAALWALRVFMEDHRRILV